MVMVHVRERRQRLNNGSEVLEKKQRHRRVITRLRHKFKRLTERLHRNWKPKEGKEWKYVQEFEVVIGMTEAEDKDGEEKENQSLHRHVNNVRTRKLFTFAIQRRQQ